MPREEDNRARPPANEHIPPITSPPVTTQYSISDTEQPTESIIPSPRSHNPQPANVLSSYTDRDEPVSITLSDLRYNRIIYKPKDCCLFGKDHGYKTIAKFIVNNSRIEEFALIHPGYENKPHEIKSSKIPRATTPIEISEISELSIQSGLWDYFFRRISSGAILEERAYKALHEELIIYTENQKGLWATLLLTKQIKIWQAARIALKENMNNPTIFLEMVTELFKYCAIAYFFEHQKNNINFTPGQDTLEVFSEIISNNIKDPKSVAVAFDNFSAKIHSNSQVQKIISEHPLSTEEAATWNFMFNGAHRACIFTRTALHCDMARMLFFQLEKFALTDPALKEGFDAKVRRVSEQPSEEDALETKYAEAAETIVMYFIRHNEKDTSYSANTSFEPYNQHFSQPPKP